MIQNDILVLFYLTVVLLLWSCFASAVSTLNWPADDQRLNLDGITGFDALEIRPPTAAIRQQAASSSSSSSSPSGIVQLNISSSRIKYILLKNNPSENFTNFHIVIASSDIGSISATGASFHDEALLLVRDCYFSPQLLLDVYTDSIAANGNEISLKLFRLNLFSLSSSLLFINNTFDMSGLNQTFYSSRGLGLKMNGVWVEIGNDGQFAHYQVRFDHISFINNTFLGVCQHALLKIWLYPNVVECNSIVVTNNIFSMMGPSADDPDWAGGSCAQQGYEGPTAAQVFLHALRINHDVLVDFNTVRFSSMMPENVGRRMLHVKLALGGDSIMTGATKYSDTRPATGPRVVSISNNSLTRHFVDASRYKILGLSYYHGLSAIDAEFYGLVQVSLIRFDYNQIHVAETYSHRCIVIDLGSSIGIGVFSVQFNNFTSHEYVAGVREGLILRARQWGVHRLGALVIDNNLVDFRVYNFPHPDYPKQYDGNCYGLEVHSTVDGNFSGFSSRFYDVELMSISNNTIFCEGTMTHITLRMEAAVTNVKSVVLNNNVASARSRKLVTGAVSSDGFAALRFTGDVERAESVVVVGNTCNVTVHASVTVVGIGVSSAMGFSHFTSTIIANNSVVGTLLAERPGRTFEFNGIQFTSNLLARDLGNILIVNNSVSMRTADGIICPLAGCIGIKFSTSQGIVGFDSVNVSSNNVSVAGAGQVGGVSLFIAHYAALNVADTDGAVNPVKIFLSKEFEVDPSFMYGGGDFIVENNNFTLDAKEDRVFGVAVTPAGVLSLRRIVIKENTITLLQPCAAPTESDLKRGSVCGAVSIMVDGGRVLLGIPEKQRKLNPALPETFWARVVSKSGNVARVLDGVFLLQNIFVARGGTDSFLFVAALLMTPLVEVRRNVAVLGGVDGARSAAPPLVYRTLRFALAASRVGRIVVANDSTTMETQCRGALFEFGALIPLRVGDLDEPSREYLDALTFESFEPLPKTVAGVNLQSPMASRTAIEISNVTVDLTCAGDSSAATATGPIVIARFPALPPSFPLDAAIHNSHFFVEQQEQRTERAVVLATVAPMLEATLLAVPSTDKTPWLRAAVNVSHSSVTTPGAFGDSLFSLEPSDQVTKIGAMSLDSALHCVRWGGEPIASRRARVVRAGSTPTMDVTVQRCGGIRASFTRSRTDNESSGTRSRSVTRSAPSETRSGTVLAPPPRYGFASDALLAAAKWGGGAAALTGSPGAMLLALRSGVLLRLAMCELHDAPEVRRHVDLRRNHTRAVMERELAFPFPALLPGLTLGARAGGAYRAVVWVDFVLVLVVLVVCLYLGTINKSKWREFVTKRQRDIEDGHVQPSAADAMLRVYFEQDVGEIPFASFAPFDRTVLKAIAFLAPFWSEAAGALLWAQPGGAGDGALAVMPLLFVFAFCLASARYVYSSVRPPPDEAPPPADDAPRVGANEGGEQQPPPPARGRRGGSARAASGGRGDRRSRPRVGDWEEPLNSAARSHRSPSSPRSSSSPRERDRPERERRQPQPQRDPAAPQLWVEPSELFVPRGAASDTHRSLHRFLQTPLARFLFVGETAWWRPFLHLPTNSLQPGPGVLTQFAYTFSTYQGPTRHEHKKKARRSSSSRGSSDARFTESFSASASTPSHVYDVSRRLLWSPSYIFVALPFLLAQMMIVGAGEADPATCRNGFFVALFVFTWPITLAALFMRPYIVPFRNGVLATVEACTLLGGFIMAGVLGDRDSEPVEATVVAGQLFLTLPATILTWLYVTLIVARFVLVSVVCKGTVATRRQLRQQLVGELDAIEDVVLQPLRTGASLPGLLSARFNVRQPNDSGGDDVQLVSPAASAAARSRNRERSNLL